MSLSPISSLMTDPCQVLETRPSFASLGFGADARATAGMLTPQADLGRMVGQNSNATGNMAGVSTAGSNTADTTSGFWSGLAGQAQDYNFDNLFKTQYTQKKFHSLLDQKGYTPTKSSAFNI